MSKYRVQINYQDKGWRNCNTCVLGISIGGEKHESHKFEKTIDWVSKRFKEVYINIADVLHRYNYMFDYGFSEEKAYEKTFLEGNKWLERNKNYIKILPNYKIYRWGDWINHAQYKEIYNNINRLYNNSDFKLFVNKDLELFLSRQKEIKNKKFLKKLSLKFLLEELAVYNLISNNFSFVKIYPGSIMSSLNQIINNSKYSNNKSYCVGIDFG
ncbi:MAG: tRNA-dependent cyclodipeptide synthase [Spirochaetota bacterium]